MNSQKSDTRSKEIAAAAIGEGLGKPVTEIIETPQQCRKKKMNASRKQLNVSSEATLFSNTSSTASKKADKENKRDNANLQGRKSDIVAARNSQHFGHM